MTFNRAVAVQGAMSKALTVRLKEGIQLSEPVNPYQLAEARGAEVWFQSAPSMEGLYFKKNPAVIVISSQRPRGRRAFTCAHELGHHEYSHGNRVDQTVDYPAGASDPAEVIANAFAGFLLMPKSLVMRAFMLRGWDVTTCTPLQAYTVANWLDVGYATLVQHMVATLKVIDRSHANELMKVAPKRIKTDFLGVGTTQELLLVDEHWYGRTVDAEVGDFIYVPREIEVEGACVEHLNWLREGRLLIAKQPGRGRLVNPASSWSSFIRVSRSQYVGRNIYRFLEECDDA